HAATWLAWPHNQTDWPGKFGAIPWVFGEIVRHLSTVEKIHICVQDASLERQARKILGSVAANLNAVTFHRWPTDLIWTRDSGPIFVVRNRARKDGYPQVALTGWRFNAWAKYPDWKNDAELPARIAQELRLPLWQPALKVQGKPRNIVLEGGSIEVNGRGTLLTTEECLLSKVQQRNPGISRGQIENVLRDYLGVSKIIWLGKGIAGDDTHGHVDDIARFVAPRTVVAAVEHDRRDINYEPLRENLRRLHSNAARDQDGKRLRVVELPMPSSVSFQGRRLPASYANFYIANRLVLVPTFNDAN